MTRADLAPYAFGPENVPSMTVQGQASEEFAPDLASVNLMIRSEAPDPDRASEDNARITKAVFDQARTTGIADTDIETNSLTLGPIFEQEKDTAGRFVRGKQKGYRSDHVFKVTVRDPAKAGSLAGALIRAGANNFLGVTFGIKKRDEIADRLRVRALEAAQQRAGLYADAAGVRLGRVLKVIPQMDFSSLVRADYRAFPNDDGTYAIPLRPGMQTVEVNVAMTWELLPK